MPQYNKADIGRAATQYGFIRDTFEKVLRLKEILEYFNTQEYLSNHLILKGGTAINLTVFELNYSLRAHILEPTYRDILNDVFKSNIKIRTVAPLEIFSAKGNALISRAAARDLYDWGNLIEQNLFADEKDLFRKCFVFYTTITADNVRGNYDFDLSAIDTLNFTKIRRDLFPVISKKDNFKLEERKIQAKQYIRDLIQLTEKENEYIERFIAKEYRPELLFDDDEIVTRICEHPMALWKCSR